MTPTDNTPDMDSQGYEEAVARNVEGEIEKFKKEVQSKLVISLIGDANAGKSLTINALTGRKLSSVNAKSGWTQIIELHPFVTEGGEDIVLIADTPGLHDTATPELALKAEQFVEKDADIILFFVNAASNRSPEEANSFRAVLALGKPTIVVFNKIDTIEEESINDVVADLKKRFGYQIVIPISAKKGTNVKALNDKILEILGEKGKDLLFLKISRYKEDKVRAWVRGAAIAAAGIGAIPLPGADIVPLTSLQVALCLKIAYIYNCQINKGDVMNLISSTVTGLVGRTIFREGIKFLGDLFGPVTATVSAGVAAAIAGSMTWGLGWAANAYYKSGMTIDLGEVAEIYKQAYSAGGWKDSSSSAVSPAS